jgi:hypothetical protein
MLPFSKNIENPVATGLKRKTSLSVRACRPSTNNIVTNCSDLQKDKVGVKGLAMLNESVNSVVMEDVMMVKLRHYHELEEKWPRKCQDGGKVLV